MGSMSDHVVRIYASTDTFGAELMKGRLQSEGISVMMKGENEGPYRMGPASLWVISDDEIRARAIVDAVGSGAFEVQDDDVLEPSEDAPE
jgi:Putative prokaryotic signal transducing protein